LLDKVLKINIDEHSFVNQPDPDPQIGRLIDDDFDDMQEDRKTGQASARR
jgi:hypothetical protein